MVCFRWGGCGSSTNRKVGGLIPGRSNRHAKYPWARHWRKHLGTERNACMNRWIMHVVYSTLIMFNICKLIFVWLSWTRFLCLNTIVWNNLSTWQLHLLKNKITAVFTNCMCAVKHVKREVLVPVIYVWRCACLHRFKVDSANSFFAQMLFFYVHPFNMFLLWCLVISGFMQQFLSSKTVFSFG